MLRVRTVLAGWIGGPGLSTAYFTDGIEDAASALSCVTRVRSAWDASKACLATTTSAQVMGEVDVITPSTGEITASFGVVQPAVVNGTDADAKKSPAVLMMLVRFRTATFVEGRRIQGRHFIGPVGGAMLGSTGVPSGTAIGAATAYGTALLSGTPLGPSLVIWQRPREADDTVTPPITERVGRAGLVVTSSVPVRWSVLRSRRD